MAVKAKKPKEAKPVFGGVQAFHYNITQCRPEQIPAYVRDIYERVFEADAPANVHWWLLKRAIGYEIMYREGRLVTKELVGRRECALKLDVNLIKDVKERSLLLSLMKVEGASLDRPAVSELPSGNQAINKENPMASKKKAAKKTPAKKAVAKKAVAKKTTGRVVGKTSGVGVQETWIGIFIRNAKAKVADRMTDAEITDYMKAEFPAKESKVFSQVQGVRNKYNKGGFKCVAPAKESVRYDDEGAVTTARGASPKKAAPAKKAVAKKAVAKKAPAKKKAAKKAAKKK